MAYGTCAIFKKGDPAEASNYKPISLLQIGYTLFAQILLQRLKDAGAESRLWPTQFGFRSGVGTAEALFLARRLIEEAWAVKMGHTILMALDWAKAFDSISPSAMRISLVRFGVPQPMVDVISAIYTDREFRVSDAGAESGVKSQHFGVSQGCPLSPFLFSIIMTTLMRDAKDILTAKGGQLADNMLCHDLLYADDTLIVDATADGVYAFMMSIQEAGANYGLALNWSKLEVLPVRTACQIRAPNGKTITTKESSVYLGALLAADGRIHSELGRRLGCAAGDFKTLERIWDHSTLPMARKAQIFDACIVTKTLYGLHTAWVSKAEQRRLDGFHARCMRRIYKIPHAYVSRVSNDAVFARSRSRPMSKVLLERQLLYFQRIANLPRRDVLRAAVFSSDSLELRRPSGLRCVGRPRTTWSDSTLKAAIAVAGDRRTVETMIYGHPEAWKRAVRRHCT